MYWIFHPLKYFNNVDGDDVVWISIHTDATSEVRKWEFYCHLKSLQAPVKVPLQQQASSFF